MLNEEFNGNAFFLFMQIYLIFFNIVQIKCQLKVHQIESIQHYVAVFREQKTYCQCESGINNLLIFNEIIIMDIIYNYIVPKIKIDYEGIIRS